MCCLEWGEIVRVMHANVLQWIYKRSIKTLLWVRETVSSYRLETFFVDREHSEWRFILQVQYWTKEDHCESDYLDPFHSICLYLLLYKDDSGINWPMKVDMSFTKPNLWQWVSCDSISCPFFASGKNCSIVALPNKFW